MKTNENRRKTTFPFLYVLGENKIGFANVIVTYVFTKMNQCVGNSAETVGSRELKLEYQHLYIHKSQSYKSSQVKPFAMENR